MHVAYLHAQRFAFQRCVNFTLRRTGTSSIIDDVYRVSAWGWNVTRAAEAKEKRWWLHFRWL